MPTTQIDLPHMLAGIKKHEAAYALKPDLVVATNENTINRFLKKHYEKNPTFYNRSKETNPKNPVYQHDFQDALGQTYRLRFWAKVEATPTKAAVSVDLGEYQDPILTLWKMWLKNRTGVGADPTNPVSAFLPNVTLQVEFPKLGVPGETWLYEISWDIKLYAYLMLVVEPDGTRVIRMQDWLVDLNPPANQGDLPGPDVPPACNEVVQRERRLTRDAFTIGAKIALKELSSALVANLPLPNLDIIKNIKVVPRELYIEHRSIALSTSIDNDQKAIQQKVAQQYAIESARFSEELKAEVEAHRALVNRDPEERAKFTKDRAKHLAEHLPVIRRYEQRHDKFKAELKSKKFHPLARIEGDPVPGNDLVLQVSKRALNILARTLLTVDKNGCSEWQTPVDVVFAYLGGRACYWFQVSDGSVTLDGPQNHPRLTLGCNVHIGGGLELKVCVRVPCADDKCAIWRPGIGANGPTSIGVEVAGDWDKNETLRLHPTGWSLPQFECYGMPPGVDVLVNLLLSIVRTLLDIFINAFLTAIQIPIVSVQKEIPDSNVSLTIDSFGSYHAGAGNIPDDILTITGSANFS